MFKSNKQKYIHLFFLAFLLAPEVYSQVDSVIQRYRADSYGNKYARKKVVMGGNQIRTLFSNDGQIGSWPDRPSGEWPKGSGHHYVDGGTPIICSRLETQFGVVHTAETSYREMVDVDPTTGQLWVMEPIPGYSNPSSVKPAMSFDSLSWPLNWPLAINLTDEWNGHWYGYFGRDVFNADLETYYVMDDSQDKEFTRLPYSFYPVLSDSVRGGLGLRIEVRGFQWSRNPIEDIIFWHYDIINISDFDHDSTVFGFYFDPGVGGVDDNGDDKASYDKTLDLVYAFDFDGTAPPNKWKTGYVGYTFLESPGNALNGIDDDEDGIIDENRDDGIDNDANWIAFTDLNGNSKWDSEINEPLNDDLGADGTGPSDEKYMGPDAGEGDGKPTRGEPNFDVTDKDESDQIGLTSLTVEFLSNMGTNSIWFRNDEYIWSKLLSHNFDTTAQRANIHILFSSGSFPLKIGKRERFSVGLLFGENLDEMIENKSVAQEIYNNDYKIPDSLTSAIEFQNNINPNEFILLQNYPNPFNPSTKISWQSPVSSWQTLKIYDVLGNEVAALINDYKTAGRYEIEFDASKLSSGIYYYKLTAGNYTSTKKMVVLK